MTEEVDIDEPVILLRINRLYRYGMTAEELYDVTRGIWRVGERRNAAKFALGVYRGIVCEVYQIDRWYPAGVTLQRNDLTQYDLSERWEFVGHVADEDIRRKYQNKSVDSYYAPSSSNPVLYVNC